MYMGIYHAGIPSWLHFSLCPPLIWHSYCPDPHYTSVLLHTTGALSCPCYNSLCALTHYSSFHIVTLF